MFPHHPNCRSAIVMPQPTTFWDIKPGGCKEWREHRQIRRFARSLPSHGWIDYDGYHLFDTSAADPCEWRIITEPMSWQEQLQRFGHTEVTFTFHVKSIDKARTVC